MQNNNIKCEECKKLMFDYASELLSEDKKSEMDRHIGLCPQCAVELKKISNMLAVMAGMEDVPVPAELEKSLAAVLKDVEKDVKNSRSASYDKVNHIPFKRIAATVVPLAAAAALAIGMYSGGVFDRYIKSDDIFNYQSVYTDSGTENNAEKNNIDENNINNENNGEAYTDSKEENNYSATIAENGKSADDDNGGLTVWENDKSGFGNTQNIVTDTDSGDKSVKDNDLNNKTINSDFRSEQKDNVSDSDYDGSQVAKAAEIETGSASNTADMSRSGGSQPKAYGETRDWYDDETVESDKSEQSEKSEQSAVSPLGLDTGAEAAAAVCGRAADSKNEEESGKYIPSKCEILTDSPQLYEKFGITVGVTNVSADKWADIMAVAEKNGDSLEAKDFDSAEVNTTITVTIKIK